MFYQQFQKLCKDHHIKESALARKLGLSPSAPGRWKTGAIPQPRTAQKIAEYFGVTTDFLLYGEDNSQAPQPAEVSDAAPELTEQEEELIRLFRDFSVREKFEVMSFVYSIADKQRLGV